MLEKSFRLPASVKFSPAKSFATKTFFLKVSQNNLQISRFGFVVSKKISPKASVRNRIRRVFRSCIEEIRAEIIVGQDMLFLLKGEILEIERKELYNEVRKFLVEKQLLK